MRAYAQLGTVHRTEPCIEYPGEWLSYVNGGQEKSFFSFEEAKKDAYMRQDESAEECETSVCWKCSDNDPRVGKVWFTGFYQHGRFNRFGNYLT